MSVSDEVIGIYERHAIQWDADRNTAGWNDKPWIDRFMRRLQPHAKVLDLGCGSSTPVARDLAESGIHVTGVDTSPTLISLCRERLPKHDCADMRRLALNARFDGILAWDSFFFLPHDDQRAMFDIFAAHAAPSAVLMFNTGPAHGEAIGKYRGEPLYHASLDPRNTRRCSNKMDSTSLRMP
jgi:trans-aconitate methyltransferase